MKKILKVAGIIIIVLVILVAGFGFWVFKGNLSQAKIRVLKDLPIPIALVDSKPLYLDDYLPRLDLAKKTAAKGEDEAQLKQQVLNEMINEQKLKLLASKHRITVSDNELDEEYRNIANMSELQGQSMTDFLASLGLNERLFKQILLKPQILGSKLNVWYNGQPGLNEEVYAKAQEVEQRVQAGEDFGKLAASYSQDDSSRVMEGDMGFLKINDLLPELKEGIDGMQPGQIKLMSSRYGIHLILLVEKEDQDGGQAHLKQIFFKTEGFDDWLTKQTKDIKVKNLIHI